MATLLQQTPRRVRELLRSRIGYVPNGLFEQADAQHVILGTGKSDTRRGEADLFRRMNYLKFRASRHRAALDTSRPDPRVLDSIEDDLGQAKALRDQLIESNLPLVPFVAKRYVNSSHSLNELVSDGNISLMRAVEKFDYARGNRFSTYAAWAIRNNLKRLIWKHRRDSLWASSGRPELLEAAPDHRPSEKASDNAMRRLRSVVVSLLDALDDRSRAIVEARVGLHGSNRSETLLEIGRKLGVSKERVRQLEARAMQKLRGVAREQELECELL